ncbi:MAG TPA: Na+/H+ antiporter [Puia sp.]|nr:Na+/H+ antiporter [Puia sp.]
MVQESLLYVISLLFAVMLLVILGQKLKIAYPIFLVIGGLLISMIPGTPRVGISPDLIFLIFLPPLLYEAAWYTSWPNFWKMRLPIILHGFGLVLVTSVIVAYLSEKLIPRFTLSIGLLLGGIISPPDAVAASSVLKYFKIPKKVKTVLEGESLVNDAASLTVFRFAVVAVISGTFVIEKAAISFVTVTIMGIFIGLVIAQILFYIHKLFSTTTNIATALTLITPYIMYLTAEHFHYSGVLAVVSGGLFLSARSKEILNHKARLQSTHVWHTLAFILNGLIFILIGLQLPYIISELKYYTFRDGIRYGLIISVLIIVIRMIWLFATTYIPILLSKKFRESPMRPNWKEVFLVGWAGMRGVISLASALAIPITLADGMEFPERDLVLFISFMVILVTLVFQGLSLPWTIKKLNLSEDIREIPMDVQAQQIHLKLMKLSLARLTEKHSGLIESNMLVKTLKQKLENEVGFARLNIDSLKITNDEKEQVKEYNSVLMDIHDFQHKKLSSLGMHTLYDEDVIQREESRIDLEQNKIG